ncbi:MAG TPA: aminotransferase class V-fold PLP-dependent enzyme [Terrimesophilobacter sp.]|nr:aminotransferase class V-fold PLP-dependent enzyme [Terrimesophilobacter sp.]
MATIDEFAAQFGEETGFLDFARLGPIGSAVVEEELAQNNLRHRARYGSLGTIQAQDERVREAVAELIGFRADQVVFQPSTTAGLVHAFFGLSGGLLLSPVEFPSVRFAAMRAAEARGVLVPTWIDYLDGGLETPGVITPGMLRPRLTPAISAVAVSLVDYRTGFVADLEGIRQVIGDRLLIVDAAQGFGVVPAAFEAADVVASGGQKWARAGWGTGFLALSDRAVERLRPVLSGLLLGSEAWPPGPVPAPPREAAAFQITLPNPVAQARLTAAVEGILAVGIDAVYARVLERTDRIIDLVDGFGLEVVSPRAAGERAGIVVVDPGVDRITALSAALHNHGVSMTVREGRVRLSAHVSTSDETLDTLRLALTEFAA